MSRRKQLIEEIEEVQADMDAYIDMFLANTDRAMYRRAKACMKQLEEAMKELQILNHS